MEKNNLYKRSLSRLLLSSNKFSFRISVIERLLYKLNNPQEKIKIIHIAGTNGKGSTCAFLSSIFLTAGVKYGLFVSPHLFSVRERILINGCYIKKKILYLLKKRFFKYVLLLGFLHLFLKNYLLWHISFLQSIVLDMLLLKQD